MDAPSANLLQLLVEKTLTTRLPRGFHGCPECGGIGWILEARDLVNPCCLCQKREDCGEIPEPFPPLDCEPF